MGEALSCQLKVADPPFLWRTQRKDSASGQPFIKFLTMTIKKNASYHVTKPWPTFTVNAPAGGDKPPPLHTNLSLKVAAGFIPA